MLLVYIPVGAFLALLVIGGIATALGVEPRPPATPPQAAPAVADPEPTEGPAPEPAAAPVPAPDPEPAAPPPPPPPPAPVAPAPPPATAPPPPAVEPARDSAFADAAQAERIYLDRISGMTPGKIPDSMAIESGLATCFKLYDGVPPAQVGTQLMSQYGLTSAEAGTVLGAASQSFCLSKTPTAENFNG